MKTTPIHRSSATCRTTLRRWPKLTDIGLLTAMLITVAVIPHARAQSPGQAPPPMVEVAVIEEKAVNPPMEHVGRVEAIQAVDVQARVQGYLEQVKFTEGSRVKAGNLLYVIEQAPYTAQVKADAAKAAEARAALSKTRQYRERLQSVRSGGVSKTDLETALADEQEARAKVDQADATLDVSRLNLDYTTIKAPIRGRIGASNVTRGNLVGPDSGPLARIVQLDPIRVVYSVSESDRVDVLLDFQSQGHTIDDAKQDLVLHLRLPNGAMYDRPGRIEFTDNEVDRTTGTVAVRAVFDNPDEILLPGQFVTVVLSLANPQKMPVVPQRAVLEDQKGQYVFVVGADNRVQRRNITTGLTVETEWAVKSGLMTGETVIVSGVQKVRSGQTVNPQPVGNP
ncbi:hemolysin secretion protein D [Desulfosarcina ovata subsp. sediminis]|uniref:Hemolysin secretion protein D n=1 Tax=Desulfosarcina ovata subsp. sediminis TaxID=885957 RepID=A0A5K7ZJN2_9BACT|nr:efflux RND transporter periplasmic adaptor subunit [Desulfosarcina ovata]BBO81594.1 hemolysin secretion protein D [Desulfosarcina ovata subsp. sediminis]